MNESNTMEIAGNEVSHFVYRVPKKNHDKMMQLNKQFVSIMSKYGATHLVLQLNNTEAPMEGVTNMAKTLSASQDEDVWSELIFYRDRKHREEVDSKMRNDESMASLFKQSLDLLSSGSSLIMGEFSRLNVDK
ncbi:MAG: DUF1428 family protein [Nitrososphaeraceae archaeon]